jgi:hypothetical protein
LKLLRQERIKDYLLMEEEYIKNQERLRPQEEKHEVFKMIIYLKFRNNLLIWFIRKRDQK